MENGRSILEMLDAAAQRGERVAVSDGTLQLTWRQLHAGSRALAARLCAHTKPGQPVGVWAERRTGTPLMFLSILAAGCFYVPLDADMPPARMKFVCENAQLQLVLGCGPRPERLPEELLWLDCLNCADAAQSPVEPFAPEEPPAPTESLAPAELPALPEPPAPTEPSALLLQEAARRQKTAGPDAPLYLVYTSGSTGLPKGVLKSHGAMQSFVESFLREYPIREDDILGNQTPFFFDASAKDLYWWLYTGCRLEILPTRLFSFPAELLKEMDARRVTVISWAPSALMMVSQLDAFSEATPRALRLVCFVGEVFPTKHLAQWRAALPDTVFVNLYGSSEIAGVCCHYRVDRPFEPQETLPIGRALPGCTVTLRDESGDCIEAPGQEGEVCVEGPTLALGYWRDAQRTACTFAAADGGRRLHTGDMAVYRPDGTLAFTSRRDHQIKHMGYRIELGEIEAIASALPQIDACACIYDARRSRLILFVQLPAGQTADIPALTAALREVLCSYMMPHRIIPLEALPHNANGKLDRPALMEQYRQTQRKPRRARPN